MQHVEAQSCQSVERLTSEQEWLIHAAYAIGKPHNYGKTLAAIVMRESFVGPWVIRVNPDDPPHGSYGVTKILLTTGMEMYGITSVWQAKAELATQLVRDDIFAMESGLMHLLNYERSTWRATILRYNPSREYLQYITDNVNVLTECGVFDYD